MAHPQLLFAVLLAICVATGADLLFFHQPSKCVDATGPEPPQDELMDTAGMTANGDSFGGMIELLAPITPDLNVTLTYQEEWNGDMMGRIVERRTFYCKNKKPGMKDNGPESELAEVILGGSNSCDPPIEPQLFDLTGVLINQEKLQGLDEESIYYIEIEFFEKNHYSCIRVVGEVYK